MKVSSASEWFSSNCKTFCNEVLNLPDFKGSEETVKFIKIFSDLFGVLNSRSNEHAGLKKQILDSLEDAKNYITCITRNG